MGDILFFVILYLLAVVPLFKLLPHFGINQLWALFAILPVGLVVLLWVMASKIDEDRA